LNLFSAVVGLTVVFAGAWLISTRFQTILITQVVVDGHLVLELLHGFTVDSLVQGKAIVLLEVVVESPALLLHVKGVIYIVNKVEVIGKLVHSHPWLIGSQGGQAASQQTEGSSSLVVPRISVNHILIEMGVAVELSLYL
jgi:hypothetical protein